MKINAKIGGRNLKLAGPNSSAFPAQIAAKPFMILGALQTLDPDTSSPTHVP